MDVLTSATTVIDASQVSPPPDSQPTPGQLWQAYVNDNWYGQRRNLVAMIGRLTSFGAAVFQSASDVEHALSGVARGQALIEAARRWRDPFVGPRASPTPVDQQRGVQWRLAVAHAGWEAFAGGVSLGAQHWKCWALVHIKRVSPLPSPEPEKHAMLRRWLDGNARMGIADYFGLREVNAAARVEQWLTAGDAAQTHEDAMGLAAALRHATVHGTLSASKVGEWGLLTAFERLTTHLGDAVDAGVRQLAVG